MSFVKTAMSSFTFQRLQCLSSRPSQSSFTFQKRTMCSVIYTFKRQRCFHLHLRLQCLQSFMLSKDYNVFIYISKTLMYFFFYRTQYPCLCFIGFDVFCFHALKKKRKKKEKKKKKKERKRRTSMSSCFLDFTSLVARLNSKISRMKLVSLSLLPFYFQ